MIFQNELNLSSLRGHLDFDISLIGPYILRIRIKGCSGSLRREPSLWILLPSSPVGRDVKRPWRGRKTLSQIFQDLHNAALMKQEPNISPGRNIQDWISFGQRSGYQGTFPVPVPELLLNHPFLFAMFGNSCEWIFYSSFLLQNCYPFSPF